MITQCYLSLPANKSRDKRAEHPRRSGHHRARDAWPRFATGNTCMSGCGSHQRQPRRPLSRETGAASAKPSQRKYEMGIKTGGEGTEGWTSKKAENNRGMRASPRLVAVRPPADVLVALVICSLPNPIAY
jgi:hypothetical protein